MWARNGQQIGAWAVETVLLELVYSFCFRLQGRAYIDFSLVFSSEEQLWLALPELSRRSVAQ